MCIESFLHGLMAMHHGCDASGRTGWSCVWFLPTRPRRWCRVLLARYCIYMDTIMMEHFSILTSALWPFWKGCYHFDFSVFRVIINIAEYCWTNQCSQFLQKQWNDNWSLKKATLALHVFSRFMGWQSFKCS